MAVNIFQGAKRIKEETEEVVKALEDIKNLKDDLNELRTAFTGVDELGTKLGTINTSLDNLEKKVNEIIEEQANTVVKYKKIWLLFLPATVLFISILGAGYIYFTSVKNLQEQNKVLEERILSVYYAYILEDKFWYDKKNKTLFLEDYKWIKEKIKEEKKNGGN